MIHPQIGDKDAPPEYSCFPLELMFRYYMNLGEEKKFFSKVKISDSSIINFTSDSSFD